MTLKQTLLTSRELDAVRDKTLSFGCWVLIEGRFTSKCPHRVTRKYEDVYEASCEDADTETMCNQTTQFKENKATDYDTLVKIIGHPLTHADLLRALGDWDNVCIRDDRISLCPDFDADDWIDIPLHYRTLEDIPEDHECWKQLCQLFNLV